MEVIGVFHSIFVYIKQPLLIFLCLIWPATLPPDMFFFYCFSGLHEDREIWRPSAEHSAGASDCFDLGGPWWTLIFWQLCKGFFNPFETSRNSPFKKQTWNLNTWRFEIHFSFWKGEVFVGDGGFLYDAPAFWTDVDLCFHFKSLPAFDVTARHEV